jgi:hypothetical protein
MRMDQLVRSVAELIQALLDVVRDLVSVVAFLVQSFARTQGRELDTTQAEAIAVFLLIAGAWVGQRMLWRPAASAKPQTVTLSTAKTPRDVVMGDMREGCFVPLLVVALAAIAIWLILTG